MSPSRRALLLLALPVAGLCVWSCGADRLEAPRATVTQPVEQCSGFEALMPRFLDILNSGKTEGLKVVMRDYLLQPEREGDVPPVNHVLRALMGTLADFAEQPPEAGSPEGEACAVVAPPLAQAHPMCELRRAMDVLVHEGRGLQALALVDPLVGSILGYVVGRPEVASTSHYEVAQVMADMCQQNATCQMQDTLELAQAFIAYVRDPANAAALARTEALLADPMLETFLKDDAEGNPYVGEDGLVAIVDLLLPAVLGLEDPAELREAAQPLLEQMPPELREQVEPALGDMEVLLSPDREPNVLRPLKRVVHCYQVQDAERHLVRMLYQLMLVADVPELRPSHLAGVLQGLRRTDERGSLLFLADLLVGALREDERAMDAAARVCRTLLSTEVPPGQTHSPAQLALPAVADLFAAGIAGEALCAADTLVYGCSGGAQPACEQSR